MLMSLDVRLPGESGNPAVIGPESLRSVILRPRLSHGFALKQTYDAGIIDYQRGGFARGIFAFDQILFFFLSVNPTSGAFWIG
jgi:hypothetical protein